jgi:hypothetical protein
MDDDGGGWLTYREAGDRLGVSAESVRAKAARKRWRRQIGNDGLARVWLPGDLPVNARARPPGDGPVTTRSPTERKSIDPAVVTALESHIKTLQADNEALKQDLTTTRADLSAHVETLKTQLAGAEARAGEEAAKTAQAIAVFQSLAQRLEAIAEARKPWWRRLHMTG